MDFNSMVNNYKPTAIGANPKTEQKPRDYYAKMVGDNFVAKLKMNSTIKYVVKMDNEENERLADIIVKNNEVTLKVEVEKSRRGFYGVQYYFCNMKKTDDQYVAETPQRHEKVALGMNLSAPNNENLQPEDENDMLKILNILSRAEKGENPEHKKIIDAVINAIK